MVRRVLKSGNPRGDDYRDAAEWVEDIRSRLVNIRGELEDIGRIEAQMEHDRICQKASGSVTLIIMALYDLCDGSNRSFQNKARHSDDLWADVRRNPDYYVIEEGSSWDWRPWGIFKRGGRNGK